MCLGTKVVAAFAHANIMKAAVYIPSATAWILCYLMHEPLSLKWLTKMAGAILKGGFGGISWPGKQNLPLVCYDAKQGVFVYQEISVQISAGYTFHSTKKTLLALSVKLFKARGVIVVCRTPMMDFLLHQNIKNKLQYHMQTLNAVAAFNH